MSENGEERRGLGRFFGPGTVKKVITSIPGIGDELYQGGKNVYGDDGVLRGTVNVITDPRGVLDPTLKKVDEEIVDPTREILRGTLDDVQGRVGRVIQGELTPEEIAERQRQIEELEREIAEDEASRNQGNEDQLDLTGGRGKHGSGGNPGSGGLNIQGGQRRPGGGSFTGDTGARNRNQGYQRPVIRISELPGSDEWTASTGGKAGGGKKAKGGLIKKAKGGAVKKAKGGVAKKVQKKAKGGAVKKKQGSDDRLDESLGERQGKESTKSQNFKSRRKESRGASKPTKKAKKAAPMKKQGSDARLDESLGERRGKESTKSQSFKSRRNESRGASKPVKKASKPKKPQSAGAAKRGWGAVMK